MEKTPKFATDNKDGRKVPEDIPETNIGKINGRTQEEIILAMECCNGKYSCEKCPYDFPKNDGELCNGQPMTDALALVNYLKDRCDRLEYTIVGVMHSVDKWLDVEPYDFDKDDGTVAATRASDAREIALKVIEKLQKELQHERDQRQYIIDAANIMKDEALKLESRLAQIQMDAVTAISNAKHYIQNGMKKLENWDYSIEKGGSEYKALTSATRSPVSIEELKNALMKTMEICGENSFCSPQCPFYVPLFDCCPMKFKIYPEEWDANAWKEDSNA